MTDSLKSMGKYTADDWWLWDFGNTEATVKVAEPTKLTDSNAANVFVIPIAPRREGHPAGWVVSRRYTPTQANNIANILRQCADAYNTATDINLAAENAGALVRSILHMHACSADATLEGDPP